MQRFAKHLLQTTLERITFNKLNIQHISCINDKAYFHKDMQLPSRSVFDRFFRFIEICQQAIPVIMPNQTWKICFDVWQAVMILIRMFVQSVKVSFCLYKVVECVDLIGSELYILMVLSFFFEVLINFNTGYYEKGIIITNKKKIIKNYACKNLIPDLLAQIPLYLNIFASKKADDTFIYIIYSLEFLIFLQIFSLKEVFNRLERTLTQNQTIASIYPLFNLLMIILLASHIVALIWAMIGAIEIEMGFQQSWLILQEIHEQSLYNQYVFSLYWSVQTMVTNLLFVPSTQVELFFSIIAILLTCALFGYVLNTIGMLLADINKKTMHKKTEREIVNRFLEQKKITPLLKERIQCYFDYLHQQENKNNYEEQSLVMKRLSDNLKQEVIQDIYEQTIKDFTIIQKFSQRTQERCLHIVEESYEPQGSEIYKKGDYKNQYLYLIEKGEVSIFTEKHGNTQTKVQTLKQGEIFGQYEFFTGFAKIYTAVSTEATSLFLIERNKFLNIIKNQKQDIEIFCNQKDCYKFNIIREDNNKNVENLKCEVCEMVGHNAINCLALHYYGNTKKLAYEYNHLQQQFRKPYKRVFGKFHALPEIYMYQECLEQIHQDDDCVQKIDKYITFLYKYSMAYEREDDSSIISDENKKMNSSKSIQFVNNKIKHVNSANNVIVMANSSNNSNIKNSSGCFQSVDLLKTKSNPNPATFTPQNINSQQQQQLQILQQHQLQTKNPNLSLSHIQEIEKSEINQQSQKKQGELNSQSFIFYSHHSPDKSNINNNNNQNSFSQTEELIINVSHAKSNSPQTKHKRDKKKVQHKSKKNNTIKEQENDNSKNQDVEILQNLSEQEIQKKFPKLDYDQQQQNSQNLYQSQKEGDFSPGKVLKQYINQNAYNSMKLRNKNLKESSLKKAQGSPIILKSPKKNKSQFQSAQKQSQNSKDNQLFFGKNFQSYQTQEEKNKSISQDEKFLTEDEHNNNNNNNNINNNNMSFINQQSSMQNIKKEYKNKDNYDTQDCIDSYQDLSFSPQDLESNRKMGVYFQKKNQNAKQNYLHPNNQEKNIAQNSPNKKNHSQPQLRLISKISQVSSKKEDTDESPLKSAGIVINLQQYKQFSAKLRSKHSKKEISNSNNNNNSPTINQKTENTPGTIKSKSMLKKNKDGQRLVKIDSPKISKSQLSSSKSNSSSILTSNDEEAEEQANYGSFRSNLNDIDDNNKAQSNLQVPNQKQNMNVNYPQLQQQQQSQVQSKTKINYKNVYRRNSKQSNDGIVNRFQQRRQSIFLLETGVSQDLLNQNKQLNMILEGVTRKQSVQIQQPLQILKHYHQQRSDFNGNKSNFYDKRQEPQTPYVGYKMKSMNSYKTLKSLKSYQHSLNSYTRLISNFSNLQQIEWDLLFFDRMKIFTIYLVQNNVDNVILKLHKLKQKTSTMTKVRQAKKSQKKSVAQITDTFMSISRQKNLKGQQIRKSIDAHSFAINQKNNQLRQKQTRELNSNFNTGHNLLGTGVHNQN